MKFYEILFINNRGWKCECIMPAMDENNAIDRLNKLCKMNKYKKNPEVTSIKEIPESDSKELMQFCIIDKVESFSERLNKEFNLSEVVPNWTPSEDLFSKGSSLKIAEEVWEGHDRDLKSSLACINFYMNRAGSNLDKERIEVLESAKDRIRRWSESSDK